MKISKITFMLFVILVMLSVSAVSASDNLTDSGIVGLDDGPIFVDVNGNDSGDGSKDSPVSTIDKAISLSKENGTIYLSDGEFKNSLNNKLTIGKSLNFIGAKDTTINGMNKDYLFEIQDNVSVSFKNIKFINAYKSPGSYSINYNKSVYGAALDIKNAIVTVDGCSFIDNVLNYDESMGQCIYGGAISNFGDLTITNSWFSNNTALSTSGLNSYGGAVYNKGKLRIFNTTFSKSRGVNFGYGAAIANDGKVIMRDSTISESRALYESKGSAIYNTGDFELYDSIIENNYIARANFNYIYGAIYNAGALTARGNIFRNNTGYYEAPTPSYKGSPNIYNSGKLNLTYNAFIDNAPFDGISTDVYYNGGDIINLDNNWWNTNENPYNEGTKINVDELNSWLILNLTPDYTKLNISDSVTINASWTNNIDLLTHIDLIPLFNVTFKTNVNGNEIVSKKQLINGRADFKFDYAQNRGLYDVTATMESFSQSVLVDVGKVFTYVSFNVNDNITYMEDLNVSVEVTSADNSIPQGTVLLKIGDETYTVDLVDGKGKCTISSLNPQKYTLDIVYDGSESHFKAFNSTEVNIKKLDVDLKLNISEIKVSQTGQAIATLGPKGVQGQAIMFVDGKRTKIVYLYNGNTSISLSKFKEGVYNITLQFVETSYYNSASASAIFRVSRYDSSINITADDVKVGENATITIKVSPDTLRGEATLIINGVENEIFIDNSTTNVTLSNLEGGMYHVTLIFDGDLRYNPVNVSTSFEVIRAPTTLTVDINQDDRNMNGTIKVRTNPKNCSGVMGVYINYNLYKMNFTNGEAEFAVKFDKGTNYVFVFYEGNKYYEDASWNTTLGVADEFVFIGENSTGFAKNDFNYSVRLIEINGIPMPQRTVTVEFNGVKYNITTNDNGFAYLPLNLDEGEYKIMATFKNATISNTLSVKRVDFNLTVSDIIYGDVEKITAVFENGVAGSVNFIGSNLNVTADIVNGTASYNYSNLDAGKYSIRAIYHDLVKEAQFTINKADFNISVNVSPATPELDEIIEVSNLENITGEIVFVFNGNEYRVPIDDEKAVLNLSKLNEGVYTVTIKHEGDKNHNPLEKSVSFRIKIFASDLNITVNDAYYYHDLIASATLNSDATGTVRFSVANITKDIEIVDGKAIWNFTGIDVGNYTLSVEYLGNEYYISSKNETSLSVFKANSTIGLYVKDVVLDENIRIYADLSPNATGSVSFSMTGYFSPRNKPVKNSTSNWYIAPLKTGEYEVIARYLGDKNYYPSNTTFILNVSQQKSVLDVELNDVGISERVMCKVSLKTKGGEAITDKVSLKIGNNVYDIDVTDGSGSLVVGRMAVGNYTYEVEYKGTYNYSRAYYSGEFKVVDDLLDAELTCNNLSKYYGGSEKLIINLKNSNGKAFPYQSIVVKIGSKTYNLVTDSKGQASVDVELNPGKYNALVVFPETEKYHASSANATVEILSTVDGIDVVKLYGSGTQYFAIFADSNAKALGNTKVTFKISENSYKVTTLPNGIAKINVNFKPGVYVISCVNPATKEKLSNKITIIYPIMGKDSSNYAGSKTTYKVRIYKLNLKPVGKGKTVKFKINGKTYKVKTNKNGYAKLAIKLKPKKYIVKVKYSKYKITNKITVKKLLSAKNISVKKSKKVKFKAKLVNSKGKVQKNKKITFKIDGKKYTAKTNKKGIATLTLKNLKVGKHKIKSSYGKTTITNKITIKK